MRLFFRVFVALAVIGTAISFSFNAQAEVLTEICVRTPDVSEAGTDTGGRIEAVLTGLSGRQSQTFVMDNHGVDDFNRNTWSCFIQGNGNNRPVGGRFQDVGPAVLMTIKAVGVEDDWCMIQAYTRRYSNSRSDANILSTSQFHHPEDGRVCFGDESYSVKEYNYKVKWPPNKDKLKVKGYWTKMDGHLGDNYTFTHTASVTTGKSNTNTNAWSVAVEVGTEVESELLGVSSSMSVTSTVGEERSVTQFTESTLEQSVQKGCSAQGVGGGNAQMQYWVWNSDVLTPFGGPIKLRTRESVCSINAPNNVTPKCRPGCFDTNDLTLQTCQTSPQCRIKLR